jgi:hypothetical protein
MKVKPAPPLSTALTFEVKSPPPTLVDMYGRPLTTEQTDETLAELRSRTDEFVVAFERLSEINKFLPPIMRDEQQMRRPEVTEQLTTTSQFWRRMHKAVTFESGSFDVYHKRSDAFSYSEFFSSVSKTPAVVHPIDNIDVTPFTDTWGTPFTVPITSSESNWNRLHRVRSTWIKSLSIDAPAPIEVGGPFIQDKPPLPTPVVSAADQLLVVAKRELTEWLGCGTVRLAKLLSIARQTLHDVGKVSRKPHARTSAAVLDAHMLVRAFLLEANAIERREWLQSQGLTLWEREGMEAFRAHLDTMLFPVNRRQPPDFAITLDDVDDPSLGVNPMAPTYDGPRGRF